MSSIFEVLVNISHIFETKLTFQDVSKWSSHIPGPESYSDVAVQFVNSIIECGLVKPFHNFLDELDQAPNKDGKMLNSCLLFNEFERKKIKLDSSYKLKLYRGDYLYVITKYIETWPQWSMKIHYYQFVATTERDLKIKNMVADWYQVNDIEFIQDDFWDYKQMYLKDALKGIDYDNLNRLLIVLQSIPAKDNNDHISTVHINLYYGQIGLFKMSYYSLEALYYIVKAYFVLTTANVKKATRVADKARRKQIRDYVVIYKPPREKSVNYTLYSFKTGVIKSVCIVCHLIFRDRKFNLIKNCYSIKEIVDELHKMANNEIKKYISDWQSSPIVIIRFRGLFDDDRKYEVMPLDDNKLPITTSISAPLVKTQMTGPCFCKPEFYNCAQCPIYHKLECLPHCCRDLNLGHFSRHVCQDSRGELYIHREFVERLERVEFEDA
jgi:hypothetical protein